MSEKYIETIPEDLEPVTREDARHMALASAIIQTHPETKNADTEDLFLRIFWTRMCAEYPESNREDLEWAKKRLRYLRENSISDETMDEIAELATSEYDEEEEIDEVAADILRRYRRAFEELAK